MQFAVFKIPVSDAAPAVEELNRFLRGHRVIAVSREFTGVGGEAYWAFCIEYLDGCSGGSDGTRKVSKVDYKEVLSVEDFAVFTRLRQWRKERAEADGVPVYALFTNEQLAEIARRRVNSAAALEEIEGIGKAKVKNYGDSLLEFLKKPEGKADETDRKSD